MSDKINDALFFLQNNNFSSFKDTIDEVLYDLADQKIEEKKREVADNFFLTTETNEEDFEEGYEPVAKGEKDFANKHVVKKKKYPAETENQFKGGVKKDKSRKADQMKESFDSMIGSLDSKDASKIKSFLKELPPSVRKTMKVTNKEELSQLLKMAKDS